MNDQDVWGDALHKGGALKEIGFIISVVESVKDGGVLAEVGVAIAISILIGAKTIARAIRETAR